MRKRKVLLLIIAWCSFIPLHAQLTLVQCQEKARENYPLIKELELLDKAEAFNLSNASKAYLPQLSITAIEGYIISGLPALTPGGSSDNGSFKFIGIGQLNQTLWDGGATRTQKEMIRAQTAAEKAGVEVSLYAIRERVNQLYFGLLMVQEQLEQISILQANLERNLVKVKASVANGLAYPSDADEVRVELVKLDQKRDEFVFTRKAYAAMLSLMTGMPIDESAKLVRPEKPQWDNAAAISRPELTLYNYQRQVTQMQDRQSRVSYMPKVGLMALGLRLAPGATLGAAGIESLSLAGLNLSWNTSGLYRDKNTRALTQLNLQRIDHQQATFLYQLNLQQAQQRADIQKQDAILAKDNEIISLRTSIRKAYEQKYQNGVCAVNDLVLAVNAESEASSTRALHELQLLLSAYNYVNTSGN